MKKPLAMILATFLAGASFPSHGVAQSPAAPDSTQTSEAPDSTQEPASAASPVHVVTGGGLVSYADTINIHSFSAQVEPDGEVKGTAEFEFRYLDLRMKADIECLAVVDHDAWLAGTIRASNDTSFIGQQIMFRVQDNGAGDEAEDMTSQIMIGEKVPECSATPPLGLMTWTHGDVRIR